MRGGARITAYGGSPTNIGAVLWLLVAAEGDAGRTVNLQAVRIGAAEEPADGLKTAGSPVPPAVACHTNGWIAAFFIEGVAPPVTGPVVLRYRSDSLWYRIELHPQRHRVRGRPWLTLRPADLGRRVIDEHLALQLPRPVAPGLIAALRRDNDGWMGTAQLGTYGRYDWSFVPHVHGPPASVNEVRLYAWQLPVACEAWGTSRDV